MVVLSLFDGIGCGRLALEKAGFKVDSYFASEIEYSSMMIAREHYPDIVFVGDISRLNYKDGFLYTPHGVFFAGHIDLVLGGSPCTDFSSIGYAQGMMSKNTEIHTLSQYLSLKESGAVFAGQSYLFWEYVRLLRQVEPTYYLLENVVMAKRWQKIINEAMGTEPILINSSLVSAQNRPRLYWTNIPNVSLPEDRGVTVTDILDKNAPDSDVSACLTVQKSFARLLAKYGYIPAMFNAYNASEIRDKACALSRGSMVTSSCATLLFVKCFDGVHVVEEGLMDGKYCVKLSDGRYNLRRLSFIEMERLQTLPDNYTNVEGVGSVKRSHAIGNGWTADVISHILGCIRT